MVAPLLTQDLVGLIFEKQADIYGEQIRSIFNERIIGINREIGLLRESGMSEDAIFDVLDQDLKTINEETGRVGGRLFGPMFSDIADATEDRLQRLEQQIADHELERRVAKPIFAPGTEGQVDRRPIGFEEEVRGAKLWRWICLLVNSCKDCIPRHSEVDTMESWINRGLPKSGFWSVCGGRCKCHLVEPASETTSFANEPLRMARRGIRISVAEVEEINRRGGPQDVKERAIFSVLGAAKNRSGVSRLIEAFNEKF